MPTGKFLACPHFCFWRHCWWMWTKDSEKVGSEADAVLESRMFVGADRLWTKSQPPVPWLGLHRTSPWLMFAGSLSAHRPAVQVPASSATSQGTTAAERTQQSHHEKLESVAAHPNPAADCSPLFIRTYQSFVTSANKAQVVWSFLLCVVLWVGLRKMKK